MTLADYLVHSDVAVVGRLSRSSNSDLHGYTNIDVKVDSVVVGTVFGSTLHVVTVDSPVVNGRKLKPGDRILAWAKWSNEPQGLFGCFGLIRSNGSLEFDEDTFCNPTELDDEVAWSEPGRLHALLASVDTLRGWNSLEAFNGAASAVLVRVESNPSPGLFKIQVLQDFAGQVGCRPTALFTRSSHPPVPGNTFLLPVGPCGVDTLIMFPETTPLWVRDGRIGAFGGSTVDQAKAALRFDGSRLSVLRHPKQ